MNIDIAGAGALIVVVIMGLVTLATRWGGVYIMSFVPIGKRVRQFIQAMSGSVLIALLTPIAVMGDTGARLALLVTLIMMLLVKKPLLAISCGVLTAALVRLI
ncbi:MAG: AzlD domain-containing protein [Pelistega sp.]|nr:AzlD domain-containing protein [Pelistega sp.]